LVIGNEKLKTLVSVSAQKTYRSSTS